MTSPLTPLLERLRAATKADRELDGLLYVVEHAKEGAGRYSVVGPPTYDPPRQFWCPDPEMDWIGYDLLNVAPAYTRSIDAAVALVEHKLPGWTWGVDTHSAKGPCGIVSKGADISFDEAGDVEVAYAPTPALAICIALLSALIAQGDA